MKQWIANLRKKVDFKPKPKAPPTLGARPSRPTLSLGFLKNPIFQNSLMIVGCAYFVADFVATAVKPLIPDIKATKINSSSNTKHKTLADYDIILTRNLFSEKGLMPESDEMNSGFGPPVKSSLPLNLTGIITVQDELKSVASVEDKGTSQVMAVRVNDYINPDVIVQKIEADRLIFFNRNSGRREFIELPIDQVQASVKRKASAGAGISKSDDNHYSIERSVLDKTLANMNEVLTQARCIPNMENGKPDGYRCFQIVPDSIYAKLGLQENDVICGLNGESINDPAKAFQIFSQLATMNSIDICIKRNGRISNKTYDFH